MSSIAQKLCDEICEKPPTKSKQSIRGECHKKSSQASSSRYDGRSTRSIIVEKKRVINKVIPSDATSKSKIINKFKSKETLINKKFVDNGFNTIITGPLKCDHDCVTMVRKRDPKSPCKCAIKGLKCNMSAKEIQTFDNRKYSHMDKACTQCVETVNCGTQFFERLSSRSKGPMQVKSKVKICNEVTTQTSKSNKEHDDIIQDHVRNRSEHRPSRSNFDNYMGARRWALSYYPTRGPDF